MSSAPVVAPAAAPTFDTTVPSVKRIHNLIKDKQEIEVKLVTGDSYKGTVKWIDPHCLCIDLVGEEKGQSMVIWLTAVAFVKYRSV
ncbi:MAG: Hfq-related RNA-binding protein [Pseudanabaenaceae cyanobacterium]